MTMIDHDDEDDAVGHHDNNDENDDNDHNDDKHVDKPHTLVHHLPLLIKCAQLVIRPAPIRNDAKQGVNGASKRGKFVRRISMEHFYADRCEYAEEKEHYQNLIIIIIIIIIL